MKITIIGAAKPGYVMSVEEALEFSGRAAGICYMKKDWEALCNEDHEVTMKRAKGTLKRKHHSVFGHVNYNILLEKVPKILAMILNNEQDYNTSEKSARYTEMEPSPEEAALYYKWIDILKQEIAKCYPKFDEDKVEKLAQENARYMISVFTPATTMLYTCTIQQWNYIIYWSEQFIKTGPEDPFSQKVKQVLREFIAARPKIDVEGLNTEMKNRGFSIFAKRKHRAEEFGENYCTTYMGTFAHLAQAHRHRTLTYEMVIPQEKTFYTPPILEYTQYEKEWQDDIKSLADNFPQGMMVQINERGPVEKFVLKCTERLCGCAQLEIMRQTKKTMDKYLAAVKDKNPDVYDYLEPYSHGPRCTFPGWKCENPCIFGGSKAFKREV
jgi:hypothetical protein